MKTGFKIVMLLLVTISFGQTEINESKTTESNLKVSDLSVSVTVDSAQDLESTFKIKDIKALLNESINVENMSFEIICNGDLMSNGEKSKLSYKVNGNSKDVNGFLKHIKKMRKAAIKYYKNNQ
ncbi:hypothetical protein [Psychroserpens sp.]|uniref:hypothetical protein n=1 Tax=Psychroserpens sp. TaxID=2020870 RepID=UPI002B27AA4E|nr:hypothetical protein [Psychroserpens sp.]